MKRGQRGLAVGALVVASGFAGLNALAYSHAGAMLRFTDGGACTTAPEQLTFWSKTKVLVAGVNIPRPGSNRRPSDLGPDCRVLSVPGASGITLASWYCNRGKETPVDILFHGYAAEKTSLLDEAAAFLDLGVNKTAQSTRESVEQRTSKLLSVHEEADALVRFGVEPSGGWSAAIDEARRARDGAPAGGAIGATYVGYGFGGRSGAEGCATGHGKLCRTSPSLNPLGSRVC